MFMMPRELGGQASQRGKLMLIMRHELGCQAPQRVLEARAADAHDAP